MNPLTDAQVMDTRIRTIDQPHARAAVERWLLRFIGHHSRFNVLDAAVLGWQWFLRVGLETLIESGDKDWVRFPMPGTASEWAADGGVVNPDTLPLVLDGVNYHVLYDTLTVDEADSGTTGWYPGLTPLALPPYTPDMAVFSRQLSYQERVMLGHLWRAGVEVTWAAEPSGEDARVITFDDGTWRILINPDLPGRDIMTIVLSHLSEHYCAEILEDQPQATAMEEGLAGELASLRLRTGKTYVNHQVGDYLSENIHQPAEERTRWWLVLSVAHLIETLLLGHSSAQESGATVEEHPSAANIYSAPLEGLEQLIAGLAVEQEGLVTGWINEFVSANPRFPVGQAVSLAWQLWERVGPSLADDEALRHALLDAEMFTTDDWAARGRGARASARPMMVPGPYRGTTVYYLAEDVEIVDLAVALDLDQLSAQKPDYAHRHLTPWEHASALQELKGLVSDYELDLLRNLAAFRVHLEIEDAEYVAGPEDLEPWEDEGDTVHLPIMATEERGYVRMAMDRLANLLFGGGTDAFDDSELADGVFTVSATALEEELVVLIAADRLGLDEEPLSAEATDFRRHSINPPGVRWGRVYDTAGRLEEMMRGYPLGVAEKTRRQH
ncbi:MAG: hypothetical protein Q4G50_11430 [Corynebacterium sp.]|uniref:hypothetical protein n=1 Tax=Corynebacterium sp. TaxID=1720 RepID=UPI0026DF1B78|nr:hypothetical protein [Corynebacterium sp.]MDO5670599.1 hypothetical protein [Corynebacterium sp.]